jgi:rod shape-determining protein MreD
MKSFKPRSFTRSNEYGGFIVMLASFFCALSLNILPLPLWMKALWPLWTVLFIVFWAAYFSDVLNPWLVCLIGLFEDVLQGSFLGEHALALLLAYFFARGMSRQIKTFSLASQMGKIAIILLVYQGVMFAFQGFYIHTFNDIFLWLVPLVTTLLLWPWILFLLHGIAVKFYIHRM